MGTACVERVEMGREGEGEREVWDCGSSWEN